MVHLFHLISPSMWFHFSLFTLACFHSLLKHCLDALTFHIYCAVGKRLGNVSPEPTPNTPLGRRGLYRIRPSFKLLQAVPSDAFTFMLLHNHGSAIASGVRIAICFATKTGIALHLDLAHRSRIHHSSIGCVSSSHRFFIGIALRLDLVYLSQFTIPL